MIQFSIKKKRKYQSVIIRRIYRSFEKIGICLLIVAFFVPIIVMRGTNASFFDEEKSGGNSISAGILDGEVTYIEYFNVENMAPGNQPDENMTFKNVGDLDFRYKIKYKNIGGDDELCDALILTAKRNGTVVYDKKPLKDFEISSFNSDNFSILVSEDDDWNFMLELPGDSDDNLEKKECQFSFQMNSWQTDFPDDTRGFIDEDVTGVHKIKTGEWTSPGDVVINEIMWMGSTEDSNDEWIELRNMTDKEIDISNWNIEHGGAGVSGHIEIPRGYSIKASGYFLITKKKWNETAIKLNSDLNKNEGYSHVTGMSLKDSGEDLILKDNNKNIIDTAWKPTGNWPAGKDGTSSDPNHQSMERENTPGDGTLAGSWHTCVSGNCNDGTYWDTADGNNYGTPGAANLSPVVMNEFVANPIGDDGADESNREWVELYNISKNKVDVSGWYFKNGNGDKVVISDNTKITGEGRMVIYLDKGFLDNNKDTLSFYSADGILEDVYKYENAGTFPEGKSFARFPDGVGIWIDPEATPGKENKMDKKEIKNFQFLAYEECFDGEKIAKGKKATICAPVFLKFLGMIKDAGDKTINSEILADIEEMKKEKEKLEEMLKSVENKISDQKDLIGTENKETIPVSNDEKGIIIENEEDKKEENVNMENPAIKEENINNSIPKENEQNV